MNLFLTLGTIDGWIIFRVIFAIFVAVFAIPNLILHFKEKVTRKNKRW